MRLIDADKVLERAYQMNLSATITDGSLALVDYLLSAEPTVDTVKHGRWKCNISGWTEAPPEFVCSVCGWRTNCPTSYCPTCGAYMVAVEE